MGSGGKWSKFVAFLLMFSVALLFSGQMAEAKGKKSKVVSSCRSVSKSQSSVRCQNGSCRSTSKAKSSSSSRTIQSRLPSGNLHAIAVAEASAGAPNQHVYSAREIANAAGVGSVFVGVGWRGQTCQHPGRPDAEATVGNKTVRIWVL
jgi:hypothetical protein